MEPIDVDKIRETGECDRETLNRLCGLAESAADMANILLRLLDKMEASGVAAPESPANDTDGILTWIDSLRAECDRLRSRVAVLEARPENAHVAGLEYKAAQLRAERDAAIRERDAERASAEAWRERYTEQCRLYHDAIQPSPESFGYPATALRSMSCGPHQHSSSGSRNGSGEVG